MNDERLPRIFVGIKLTAGIAEQLAQLAQPLERFAARLVRADDLHLTLVPPWNEAHLPETMARLRRAVQDFPVFGLAFEHVRYGPDPKRPRMLWAVCRADGGIADLNDLLLQAFQVAEPRPFLPHVTLARLARNGRAVARKNPLDRELALIQRVDSVQLFRSPAPGSVGYQVLVSAALRVSP
jgi:2'-5' RNA ligase